MIAVLSPKRVTGMRHPCGVIKALVWEFPKPWKACPELLKIFCARRGFVSTWPVCATKTREAVSPACGDTGGDVRGFFDFVRSRGQETRRHQNIVSIHRRAAVALSGESRIER